MTLKLYQRVVFNTDHPKHNLKKGDIGTLIDIAPHPAEGEDSYILEIFNAKGESVSVIAIPQSQVDPLPDNAILSVRLLAV